MTEEQQTPEIAASADEVNRLEMLKLLDAARAQVVNGTLGHIIFIGMPTSGGVQFASHGFGRVSPEHIVGAIRLSEARLINQICGVKTVEQSSIIQLH